MRKSERLRLLEIEVIKLQYQLELLHDIVSGLLESGIAMSDMEAGKWYRRPPQGS
jgi:hypothetical protein